MRHWLVTILAVCGILLAWAIPAGARSSNRAASSPQGVGAFAKTKHQFVVGHSSRHDTSPALRSIPPIHNKPGKEKGGGDDNPSIPIIGHTNGPDPVVQSAVPVGAAPMPATSQNFEGVSEATSLCNCAPPDPNGAVGLSAYLQIVNGGFEIWGKSGTPLYGPAATNTVWSGFGGPCETHNDGDPIVVYDSAADRFVISQFTATSPYYECVAVSQTGDPTGSWYRYAFLMSSTTLADYPKLAVWPDGIYMSANMYLNGTTWAGSQPFVFDRSAMEAGLPATYQTTSAPLGTAFPQVQPASQDGATPPPAGAPDPYIGAYQNGFELFRWHVDWATPSNTSFDDAGYIPAAPWTELCPGTRSCIPQPGVTDGLDALGDRLMFRVTYRNFGDHESLLINHTVDAGGGYAGVRWYELRSVTSGTPVIYQQSTYAPDDDNRWMGSIAMDGSGDIALGYSVASASTYPSIRYAGRLATDPLNTLTQPEATLVAGTGSQTASDNRWGDYSDLTVDPADDCTFWYTNEYYTTTSGWNWHTRIGSFTFPSCGASTGTPSPTATDAATATPTDTLVPPTPTDTPTSTPTDPPVPTDTATPVPTDTPVPPTSTDTAVPPSPTDTPSPTPTDTPNSPTPTDTPLPTATNTPSPTPTSTLVPPIPVFSDGFESGDLSSWNGITGHGTAAVVAAAAHSGNFGLRLSNRRKQVVVVVKALSTPVASSQTSFWVRVNSAAGLQTLAQARDQGSSITKWSLLYDPTQQGVWFYPYNGSGSSTAQVFTGPNTLPLNTWTQLTVDYTSTTTGGAELLINNQTQPGWAVSGDYSTNAPYQRLQLWDDAANTTDFDDVAVSAGT